MYLLLLSIPFLNFLLLSLFSRNIWLDNIKSFIIQSKFFLLILTFIVFNEIIFLDFTSYLNLSIWFQSEWLTIYWGFVFDGLVAIMLLVVSSISSCVHIYSLEYMGEDPHLRRFLSYISLFTFLMFILVSANNFIQLFVGWEGVGLSSYLLINFWFNRLQANKAALKAMIVNRIGDVGLAIGMFLLFNFFTSLEYETLITFNLIQNNVYYQIGLLELNILDIICFCLFIGAVGKSAQIGLHVWLPDAMEGPTPVSALIHAATMVTAGVFLICRVPFLFENSILSFLIISIVGSLTALMAGTIGLVQNDLKKVVAYSTCSQLGYMILVCGVSGYKEAMYHLTTHAFFKAGLFLGAGSLIHAVHDEQDMRKLGSLFFFIPFTAIIMVVCSCSLCGMPFSSGFFSKDFIIEVVGTMNSLEGSFLYWIGFSTAVLTAIYSSRSLYLSFYDEVQGLKKVYEKVHEGGLFFLGPLFFLLFAATSYGQELFEIFLGYANNIWSFFKEFKIKDSSYFNAELSDLYYKQNLPYTTIFSITGLYCLSLYVWKLNIWEYNLNNFLTISGLYHFLNKKWYFDKIYNSFINSNISKVGYNVTYQNIDRGIIEDLGPNSIRIILSSIARTIKNIKFGILYQHILLIVLGFVLLLLLFFNLEEGNNSWFSYFQFSFRDQILEYTYNLCRYCISLEFSELSNVTIKPSMIFKHSYYELINSPNFINYKILSNIHFFDTGKYLSQEPIPEIFRIYVAHVGDMLEFKESITNSTVDVEEIKKKGLKRALDILRSWSALPENVYSINNIYTGRLPEYNVYWQRVQLFPSIIAIYSIAYPIAAFSGGAFFSYFEYKYGLVSQPAIYALKTSWWVITSPIEAINKTYESLSYFVFNPGTCSYKGGQYCLDTIISIPSNTGKVIWTLGEDTWWLSEQIGKTIWWSGEVTIKASTSTYEVITQPIETFNYLYSGTGTIITESYNYVSSFWPWS